MKAKCRKCGAGFKFDEAKVQKKALIRCPKCNAKNLLEQDPNSAEPNFFISLFEEPKKEVAKGNKETKVQEHSDEDRARRLEAAQKEIDNQARQLADDAETKRKESLPSMMDEKDLDSAPLELDTSKNKNIKHHIPNRKEFATRATADYHAVRQDEYSEHMEQGLPDLPPPAVITKPAKTGRALPGSDQSEMSKVFTRDQTTRSLKKTLFLAASALAVVAVVLFFLFPGEENEENKKRAKGNKGHEGKEYVDLIIASQPSVKGTALEHTKKAEEAYQQDIESGYRDALGLFKKALILDQDNAELMVRYTESYIRAKGGKLRGVKLIRNLMDLLNYGEVLAPDLASLHRAKSSLYMSIGKNRKAVKEAKLARTLEPHNIENLVVLAEAYVDNDPQKTVDLLSDLYLNRNFPLMAIKPLALAYEGLGEFSKAEKVYLRRDKIDTRTCVLCKDIGELYESIGLYEKALDIYNKLIRTKPGNHQGYVGKAHALWQSGKALEESINVLSSIDPQTLSEFSKKGSVEYRLARSHYFLLFNDLESAKTEANLSGFMDKTDPEALYQMVLANSLQTPFPSNKKVELENKLSELEIDLPSHPETWALKGLFAKKNNDLENAIKNFKRAIKTDPSYYHGHFQLASLYLDVLNIKKAFSVIDLLTRYKPEYWVEHPDDNLLTDVFKYEDKLIEQLEVVDDAKVDRDKKYFILGFTKYLLGRYKEATKNFQKVLSNNSSHLLSQVYLAYAEYKLGNIKASNRYIEGILKKHRNNAATGYLKSRILYESGKKADAVKLLQRLTKANGENASLFALLSIYSKKTGKRDDAKLNANNGYRLDPDSKITKQARYLADN